MSEWKPQESLGGLIIGLSIGITKASKNRLMTNGLGQMSFGRFWVLHALHQHPQNQASLCNFLNQSAPSMMEMLQRLHKDKLIKAKVDSNDSRKKEWSLTEGGKRDYLKARELLRDVGRDMDRFFEEKDISPTKINEVKRILSILSHEHFGAAKLKEKKND